MQVKSGFKYGERVNYGELLSGIPTTKMRVGDYVEFDRDQIPDLPTFRSLVSQRLPNGFGVSARAESKTVAVVRKS